LRLGEYIRILDAISPFELQESWDNSGLQVGDPHQEIEKVYVAVDVDAELIGTLPQNSLLITHHPLIFSPLKFLNATRYPDALVMELVRKGVAMVALHTNFDKTHLGPYVARRVLGAQEVECEEFVCYFEKELTFDAALEWVGEAMGLPCLRYVKGGEKIQRVALVTGSGGSFVGRVEADLLLTGDLKYHDAMKAKNLGLSVIDIGHYESEVHFAGAMAEQLKKNEIEAIIAPVKNPLSYKGIR
jgi:dinuclear metal center YbgI/SA1388 family protein